MPSERLALVVDDDSAVAATLAEALSSAGYVVETAHDADTARGLLGQRSFQIALLDCVIAGSPNGGLSLAHLARDRGVAVVLVSGAPEMIEKLPLCGFRYMVKPFRLADMLQAVEQALGDLRRSKIDP
jgi:DNA-binding NtrC family response regulator